MNNPDSQGYSLVKLALRKPCVLTIQSELACFQSPCPHLGIDLKFPELDSRVAFVYLRIGASHYHAEGFVGTGTGNGGARVGLRCGSQIQPVNILTPVNSVYVLLLPELPRWICLQVKWGGWENPRDKPVLSFPSPPDPSC